MISFAEVLDTTCGHDCQNDERKSKSVQKGSIVLVTVKISNQMYDYRHEDCLPVGTEFSKFKENWAERAEQEEDHPIRVMTRLASKKKA
jgi:hypothetical protein